MKCHYNFGDYDLPPKNVHMQHMPVALLLDLSGSMNVPDGRPIRNLNLAANKFLEEVARDPAASGLVDVAVIGFNDEATVIQGFRPVTEIQPLDLTAGGGTNLSAALELAVQKLRERCNYYANDVGIEIKMPYIILVTDGYGGDVTEIARVIKQRTDDKKMQLWVLAVEGYDEKTVAELTEGKRVFALQDSLSYDFTQFFQLMAASAKAVSQSAPGERIHIDNPLEQPDNNLIVPDLDDWLNN